MGGGATRAIPRPFTPSREHPEALQARTVGLDDALDTIHRRLRSAATTGNRSHTLLVGPRGSGKTHLLALALHRVRADPELAARLAVAQVEEDAVGINTYGDLLLEILRSLRGEGGGADRLPDLATTEAAIIGHLGDRVLVAVIENLARVFENLGAAGQRNLRSFVEGSGQVMVLASTPVLFRAIGARDEPWFGSFAVEHLPELTLAESVQLISRLAADDGDEDLVRFLDTRRGHARLAALHHLVGGSPRLWTILAGFATAQLLDDLVRAVEALLEKLVPYHQQRLWDLPGNEAKLVRELGTGPVSAPVSGLARACGLDERTAATALGRLAETGWVRSEKVPGTDQRKSWYRLREPLLRHHFQYRETDGEALRFTVEVLRLWFDPDERRTQLADNPASPSTALLVELLQAGAPLPPVGTLGSFASTARFGVLRDLAAARAGSAEARTRLPAELRSLTERPARPRPPSAPARS